MKNKNQWVTRFQSLDPNYQVEIAEKIIEELNLNEEALDDDEYDKKKSQLLKFLLDEYIKKSSNKVELLKLQEAFDKFNNLSEIDKLTFINKVFCDLVEYCSEIDKRKINEIKKQEKNAKKEFCKANGHDFGEWEKKRSTTLEKYGPSGIEALYTGVGTIEVEHIKWERKCKYCGYIQKTNNKPAEIKANEIKNNIRTLKKQLNKLNID